MSQPLTPDLTLAELATLHPAGSRIFRRHHLDYCCGGGQSLARACEAAGLDVEALLGELTAAATPSDAPPVVDASLTDLIQHILTRYHEPLRTELPELVAMAAKVENRHGDKESCPKGLHAHLAAMHEAILLHLAKEEQVLFPMIMQRGVAPKPPVTMMHLEHDEHGRNLKVLRALAQDFVAPEEACATWRALYLRLAEFEGELMDHIHLENNLLFPRALTAST